VRLIHDVARQTFTLRNYVATSFNSCVTIVLRTSIFFVTKVLHATIIFFWRSARVGLIRLIRARRVPIRMRILMMASCVSGVALRVCRAKIGATLKRFCQSGIDKLTMMMRKTCVKYALRQRPPSHIVSRLDGWADGRNSRILIRGRIRNPSPVPKP